VATPCASGEVAVNDRDATAGVGAALLPDGGVPLAAALDDNFLANKNGLHRYLSPERPAPPPRPPPDNNTLLSPLHALR
jgi:hypothetical protein